jgi:hypothetical protein
MKILVITLIIYVLVYFISLVLMHKYKRELEIDHYDPPHGDYVDYDSNATAYLTFSFAWPLFWFVVLIRAFWRIMTTISEKIGEKYK